MRFLQGRVTGYMGHPPVVLEEDRNMFYRFIYEHLTEDGIALVCSMGDGIREMQSDTSNAFKLQEREHRTGKMQVVHTSCRMVSFETFENEITSNNLVLIEKKQNDNTYFIANHFL